MTRLNMNKIAKGLGAKRRGKVKASAGYFGAMQLLADIESRFRASASGAADAKELVDPKRRTRR